MLMNFCRIVPIAVFEASVVMAVGASGFGSPSSIASARASLTFVKALVD